MKSTTLFSAFSAFLTIPLVSAIPQYVSTIYGTTTYVATQYPATTAANMGFPVYQGHYIYPAANTAFCLTAPTNADGAQVFIQPCTKSTSQFWTYGAGTLFIYGTKCLDVTNGSTANGNKLQIWDCTANNVNQQFWPTQDDRISWTNHGQCMDLTGGDTSGASPIQMWQCTDGNWNQAWYSSSA